MEPDYYEELKQMKIQEMEMRIVIRDIIIYFVYIIIIFIISYGNRNPDSYLAKEAMEKAIIYGGTNCDIFPIDDLRYKPCKPGEIEFPYVNYNRIRDINEWYGWIDKVLIPNVRVQPWYNGNPPYSLRGYMDDKVNRLIGYAIVRQVREELGSCRLFVLKTI